MIALYGRAATHDSAGVKDLHYAAAPDPQLLEEWLDGTGYNLPCFRTWLELNNVVVAVVGLKGPGIQQDVDVVLAFDI